jgi:hypothetical protein
LSSELRSRTSSISCFRSTEENSLENIVSGSEISVKLAFFKIIRLADSEVPRAEVVKRLRILMKKEVWEDFL